MSQILRQFNFKRKVGVGPWSSGPYLIFPWKATMGPEGGGKGDGAWNWRTHNQCINQSYIVSPYNPQSPQKMVWSDYTHYYIDAWFCKH